MGRIIIKWLSGMCMGLLLLSMFTIGAMSFLVGTPSGLKFALDSCRSAIPVEFSVHDIRGGLLGHLVLKGIKCTQDDFSLEIGEVVLVWTPMELFERSFHLKKLKVDHVRYVQLREPEKQIEKKESAPFALPDIVLPIAVVLDDIQINGVRVVRKSGGRPLDINRLALSASLSHSGLNISALEFLMPGVTVHLRGKLDPRGAYPMDFSMNWSGLQWPLLGTPQYVSEKGVFSASGTPHDYTFSLDANMNGKDIPDIQMQAEGNGTEEDVNIERFHAELLSGDLDLHARAAWKPFVSWKAVVSAADIDPGMLASKWPGSIAFELDTHGKIENKTPDFEVNIKKFQGLLREKKISGTGRVIMADGDIIIDDMKLGCGSAGVEVQGVVGGQWDLKWDASVPDASELLTNATGSIRSSGRLYGTSSSPVVSGMAAVNEFAYSGSACRKLDMDFSLFRDESTISSLKLRAAGISSGSRKISKASVDLRGTLSQHTLALAAVNEAVTLNLGAEHGSYDVDKKSWSGVLNRLGLDAKDFGAWNLAEPVMIALSADDINVPWFCLRDSDASVCMKAHWLRHGEGRATASVRGISLERAMRFLPPRITELSGMVSADMNAVLGTRPLIDLVLSVSPGQMTFMLDQARQVRIRHQGGRIDADLGLERLSADLKLSMGENGVSADIEIPRELLEKDARSAPVKGAINLNVRELGLITAFVPAVKDTAGEVTADLNLGGTLGDPRMDGDIMVNVAGPHLPVLGLDLDKTVFHITAHSAGGLDINGHMNSGGDSLKVTGNVALDASRGWPAHIELTGSNFKVIDIPDAMVRISPHIKLDYSGISGVRVRGTVAVPVAEITPREIPAGVEKPSEDVVIVSAENSGGEKPGLPVDADVALELLDNVHVRGFGLDCYVKGKLIILMSHGKQPAAHGELRIKEGTFRFYGYDLTIEKGIISYAGGSLDNPGVNLLAVRYVGGIPVGVRVTGYVTDLNVSGYSPDPSVSSRDAFTMLITGKTRNDPDFSEAVANTAAIAGADMVAQQLKGYTGLDYLDVKGSGKNSSAATVFAGKDITKDLTVGVEAGTDDDGTQFVVRYNLWNDLDLEIKSGSSMSGMNLLYTIEFR